eukprot:CAMPEP_0117444074 /NCGR_PEP_ID=MMETSP0759-20121206/5041_1 /TAXON_ID=63605 /ORGANISM="Percolomonas cosmopolitus, Strain WS" /LENGTH=83 /DNA_ID=CAMNT_0005236105 /DNA_START=413 /DNA_END=661 /DNA_ORIENTATION=-
MDAAIDRNAKGYKDVLRGEPECDSRNMLKNVRDSNRTQMVFQVHEKVKSLFISPSSFGRRRCMMAEFNFVVMYILISSGNSMW